MAFRGISLALCCAMAPAAAAGQEAVVKLGTPVAARAETFEPLRSPYHTCKPLAGPVVPVALWMCLVEGGNVLSRNNDLLVVAIASDVRAWDVEVEDCVAEFARRDGRVQATRSRPTRLVVGPQSQYRRFVLQEALSPQERAAWRTASVNACRWKVSQNRPMRNLLAPGAL